MTCKPPHLAAEFKTKLKAVLQANNPGQMPVELGLPSARDCTFTVELLVGWRWVAEWSKQAGQRHSSRDTRVANRDDGERILEQRAQRQAERERYVETLLAAVIADPAAGAGMDAAVLAPVDGAVYCLQNAEASGGLGGSGCGCAAGRIACPSCGGGGKSGDGLCPACMGIGTRPCPRCGGRQAIDYLSCHARGWSTFRATAAIHSTVTRTLTFPPGVPQTFSDTLRAKSPEWCRDNADWTLVSIGSTESGAVTIAGTAPMVSNRVCVGGRDFVAECFGATGDMAEFPPFLDPLLTDTVAGLENFANDPAGAYAAIRKSSVLTALFDHAVAGRDGAVAAARRQSHGAASEALLSEAESFMRRGLGRIRRKHIRRTWLAGLVLTSVMAPLIAAADVWRQGFPLVGMGAFGDILSFATASLVPVFVTWLATRYLWLKEVRRVFGDNAARVPRPPAC